VELRSALGQLQQVDRAKSRFFANVSHELRTPLTLILAPVEHLLEAGPEAASTRELHVIRNNAGRLLRLIDELLDLSRLDAGALRLNVAELDFGALVQSILDDSDPLAQRKLIRSSFDGVANARIFGDAYRLESIVSNLVGNAFKYTQAGGHVRVSLSDVATHVVLDVEDDGPGIAEEDLPHVFERFFRAAGQERRREGGVGIGLALAKELAELHGGELSVRSDVGRGTTFSLKLPKGREHFRPEVIERRVSLAPSAPGRRVDDFVTEADTVTPVPDEPDTHVVDPNLRGRRILVVEDRDELRAFVAALLSEEHTVLEAADGESGLAIVKREHPDLVLSDVMMPGGSGTDLCSRIKRDPALRDIPVVLLTARVGSEATLDAYAHGADDFVAKPFHPRVLLARVRAQLRLRALGLEVASREKLAVVGTLSAGVAHEVRNPLNALSNAVSVLLERELPPETVRRLLSVIGDAAERIRLVVSALDVHARPAEAGGITPCDVSEGVDATLRLVEYRLTGVTIVRVYATKRAVFVSAGAVNQVVLNLVDNALRAGATELQIGIRDESRDVVVSLADNGPGIPPEIAERIFDPFFTTRAPGDGTGLGLYLARRIVRDQGGELRLVRGVGGAEFEMRLPASAPARRATMIEQRPS
jgi:signal transduction histidine kinase